MTGFRGAAFTRHGRAEAQGATLASQARREQSENWSSDEIFRLHGAVGTPVHT